MFFIVLVIVTLIIVRAKDDRIRMTLDFQFSFMILVADINVL
jgi:hypothetical protein